MVSTFESVDKTQMCDRHSNERNSAALSSSTVSAVEGGSNLKVLDETLVCDHSNESY